MEELDAIKQAKQGDENAFAFLFNMFSDRIYRFISYKVNVVAEREDILQDVFVKAWKGLPKYRVEELNFSAWLYKIALNSIIDFYRKQARKPESVELMDDAAVTTDHDNQDSTLMIDKVFKELNPDYKTVLELRYIQGFELDEIAQVLDKTNLAVRLLVHRALKQSRIILEKYDT